MHIGWSVHRTFLAVIGATLIHLRKSKEPGERERRKYLPPGIYRANRGIMRPKRSSPLAVDNGKLALKFQTVEMAELTARQLDHVPRSYWSNSLAQRRGSRFFQCSR